MNHSKSDTAGTFASFWSIFWGLGGFSALLLYAIYRLGRHMLTATDYEWSWLQWLVCIANVLFMAWSEGYRGFHQSFSPRTVARAMYLSRNPSFWPMVLAPVYCAGYFGAAKRVRMVVWIGTVLIVLAVLVLQQTPQPWRGIIDAGVVVGLTWGTASLMLTTIRGFASGEYPADPRISDVSDVAAETADAEH